MPSWAPAIINGIWPIARTAARARALVAASGSTTVRREAINENSPPTKKAFPSSRRMVSATLPTVYLRRGGNAHLLDPAPLDVEHGELPLAENDRLTGGRDVAELSHEESGQRLVRALREPEAGQVGELVGAEHAVDEPRVLLPGDRHCGVLVRVVNPQRDIDQARLDRVVLVGDLADQLLDEVLDRHNAIGAAVLVHHDGKVLPSRLKRRKHSVEVQRLRYEDRLPGHPPHWCRGSVGLWYAQQV